MMMTGRKPPGGDPLSDPRKRDPGTADDEFARFREQQLAKRRSTQRRKQEQGTGPITAQERARAEIRKLEDDKGSRSRGTSRKALERARQELRETETRPARPRPSAKLSRETMLRGRAEVQAREASAGKRRPTGRVSRDTVDKAKREREALDQAEAVRMGRRPVRRDPPSDPAVRPDNASDAEFEKFRRLQMRKQRLEQMGLDKNPDIKPDESAGAFFGTTPVERQQIRGATASFRAEELQDLAEHQDEVVSDLQPIDGVVDEIPDDEPAPTADDWLDRMD